MESALPSFRFANREFPGHAATDHFLVVGATKSGKSTILDELLVTAIQPVGKIPDYRALVYDAKGNMIPFLQSILGSDEKIHVLNAFDKRSSPWDIAKDIPNPTIAREIAAALCADTGPSNNNKNKFFEDQSQSFVTQAILALKRIKGDEWTLRDLCNTFRSFSDLELVLANTEEGRAKIENFKHTQETRDNALQSAERFIEKYSSIAAAWYHSNKPKISLTDWANKEGCESILVMGYDPDAIQSLNQINQAIFKRCVQLVAKKPDSNTSRSWFFLDEATQIGSLPEISTLHRFCRSKGAACVFATQSIIGLETVYSKQVIEEINSNSGFKALLRTHGFQDARWASDQCGKYIQSRFARTTGRTDGTSNNESWTSGSSSSYSVGSGSGHQHSNSYTHGRGTSQQKSTSINQTLVDADVHRPEKFMKDMKAPSEMQGIHGVFFCEKHSDGLEPPNSKAKGKDFWEGPIQSVYYKTSIKIKNELTAKSGYMQISDESHILPMWSEEERRQLTPNGETRPYPEIKPFRF